jgi:hypothetical protein|eukprot:COSAG01_NODE_290_length_19382_cov_22.903801_6_plen_94_part_00
MGHTVESRPRGAGRPPGTRPSHGYRSATHVHVQARLRMQDGACVHLGRAKESLPMVCSLSRPSDAGCLVRRTNMVRVGSTNTRQWALMMYVRR